MWTKAGGTDHLFLFTYANDLLWDMVFVLIFIIYLFIYSKRCQQKQVEPTTCLYLLMQKTYSYGWIRNQINVKFKTNFFSSIFCVTWTS